MNSPLEDGQQSLQHTDNGAQIRGRHLSRHFLTIHSDTSHLDYRPLATLTLVNGNSFASHPLLDNTACMPYRNKVRPLGREVVSTDDG